MARARKRGDDATNARKRYYRSANRNLKKADKLTGAAAERYRLLARRDFENALRTYDPSKRRGKLSKPMQRLANRFGMLDVGEVTKDERQKVISRSEQRKFRFFEGRKARREREAEAVFRDPTISSRIWGGLVDVWRDASTVGGELDRQKMIPALMDYFGVDTYADLLERVEAVTGEGLYAIGDEREYYDTVKLTLQAHVLTGSVTI